MKNFFNEFKTFISRGNVMDMAVGVIVGGAFTNIVTSLTDYILMPVILMICGQIDLSSLVLQVGETKLLYGNFIQSVITFLITAFAVFCMVKAMNAFRFKKKEQKAEEAPKPDPQIELLTQIRDLLEKEEKN